MKPNLLFRFLPRLAPVLAVSLCLLAVARFALAGSPAKVRAADVNAASVELRPARGLDDRTEVPTDTALVGGNGVVEPIGREIAVAAQVPGVVREILVREGQFVQVGEPLLQFDDAVELGALAAAEGEVAAAAAELKRLTRGARSTEIEGSIADAEAAKSRAELSASQLGRVERLARSGASSPEDLDRARAQAKSDQQTVESADARRRQVLAGTRDEDVLAARGRLRATEGRRAQAQATVDRLRIKAPSAGEILQIKIQPGEYAASGGPALVLVGDTRDLRVRMDVEERDLSSVAVGDTAFVVADAFPGRRFKGSVIEVGRRMGRKNVRSDDPTERIDTKIREVVVDVTDEEGLVSGMRVMTYVTRSAAPRPVL